MSKITQQRIDLAMEKIYLTTLTLFKVKTNIKKTII